MFENIWSRIILIGVAGLP